MSKPTRVDLLVVHQVDVAHAVPGGIDGVIRGILRFSPPGTVSAVVGVIAESSPGREVGRWERHMLGGREIMFLPVAALDASDQSRRVPHSIRLASGLAHYRSQLPQASYVHAHRADIGWAVSKLLPGTPLVYFVHTQEQGLTSGATDSFWRRAPQVHAALEHAAIRAATSVVVFNPDYAKTLAGRYPYVRFSPNWYEPDLVQLKKEPENPYRVVWLGRVEPPKDPALAVATFAALCEADPEHPWELAVVGSGTLDGVLRERVAALPSSTAARVHLLGQRTPAEVGQILRDSGVFLMTSVPGYEGHPRVLIEALGSGLPSVVTQGSDTGSLIEPDTNGFVRGREPRDLADAVVRAQRLDRGAARASVERYSAPAVVDEILQVEPRIPRTIFAVDRQGQASINGNPLFRGNLDDLLAHLTQILPASKPMTLETPNTDFLILAEDMPAMAMAIADADILIPDGAPVVGLGKVHGAQGLERLTGADLLPAVARIAPRHGWRIAVTGGAPGVAAKACENLRKRYGTDAVPIDFPRIASPADPAGRTVVQELQQVAPQVVFVCLGAPKQEAWVEQWRDELPAALYIGAGAAVDFVAGVRVRAPHLMQVTGLEWLFRLGQEPRRLAHRYLVRGPRFLLIAGRAITAPRGHR